LTNIGYVLIYKSKDVPVIYPKRVEKLFENREEKIISAELFENSEDTRTRHSVMGSFVS